ncbi:MAG: polyketide synthase dehydratase domain-containing protein, partial [Actinoallomurus sp.]
AELDAAYWYRNLRGRVGFEPAVRALADNGTNCFIEISPHPVLTMAVEETIQARDAAERVEVIGSLRRDEGGFERFATSLAAAHIAGAPVDWPAFYTGSGARRVELPTYAFQRERYWLTPGALAGDPAAAGLLRLEHPVLAGAVQVGDRDEWLLTGRLSQEKQPWTQDHAVLGMVIMPGAALVELALTAGRRAGHPVVDELVLEAPLILDDDAARQVQVTVAPAEEDGRREVAIYSRPELTGEDTDDDETAATCHARGWLTAEAEPPAPFPAAWPPPGAEQIGVDGLYPRLAEAGYDYGPLFQGVRAAWRDGENLYTEVALPDDAGGESFGIHPALFDATLHGGLIDKAAGSSADLPFSWSGVRLGHASASRVRVRIAPAGDSALRIDAVDETGAAVVSVDGIAVRPVDQAQLESAQHRRQRSLFHLDWATVTPRKPAGTTRIAILGDDLGGTGDRFDDLSALERALAEGATAPEAVLVTIEPPARTENAAEAAREVAARSLDLLQRWLASERLADARLVVVTRTGVAVGDEAADLARTPTWGLVRSAQSEHPERFVLVDLDGGDEPDWQSLIDLDEPQLVVREGRLLAPRLARASAEPAGGTWRLGIERKGSLEDLGIIPSEADRPLGVHEVRVGVRAAGLNFRDVLIALGLYPGDAPLGSEAAGVVLEVGSEVRDLSPGDRVVGLVLDSFGPVAVADRRMIVPMPAGFSFAQAAALPVVYLTAYYGLVDLADLRQGERLLVHAAAGGVGMAAVQLARHLGAEVFATASLPK